MAVCFPIHEQAKEGDRLPLNHLKTLFAHHEVAAHGFTHSDLTSLSDQDIRNELINDIEAFDQCVGQSTLGFAYQFVHSFSNETQFF
jgi:peptidoglycan/xylan/chitin deacetylase (PgdA/CDA1 family)